MTTSNHPLSGIRILDLTRLLPGAVATQMLVDLGAEVIKIEDPNGGDYARWYPPLLDGQSVFFRMNNRNKRSMVLNLKEESGQAVLHKLVETADVLVEGFRPGVMKRLNSDYEALKAINPKLVYCAISGWGADGPYVDKSGHDLNYVAIAGLIGSMETPQVMGGQVGDIGGAYIAAAGILAALLRRERGGEGAFIDTSLMEASVPFALYNWTEALHLQTPPGQGTLSGGVACYRVYAARDGQKVTLAALEPKFWENFCVAVQRPDLVQYHLQAHRQTYLIKELDELFALKPASEWNTILEDVDCCFSLVNDPGKVADNPHLQQRGMLGTFPDGATWMRSPLRVSDSEPVIENVIPGYGEHTHAIMTEAGYDEATIKALVKLGIVR